MKRPSKEEYESMTDVQRNRWFLQFQQMHQTMWGFNPHGAEYFNSEMLLETVTQAADFFGLSMPKVTEVEDTVARIKTNEEAKNTELFYNLKVMQDSGVNNLDALRLCLVHEMCHQALRDTRFWIFPNELWIQELACDLVVGAYAEKYFIATNKYKWVVGMKNATPTHPDGQMRKNAVDYGRENLSKVIDKDDSPLLDRILHLVPSFVYEHMLELAKSWKAIEEMDWEKTFFNPPPKASIDIDRLPESNLIRQAVLKYRAQLKEKENHHEDYQQ